VQPSVQSLLPQITRVLALAIHFDEMIRRVQVKDFADIGWLSCPCRERVSQIMRLTYLAPDIQMMLYLPPTPTGRFPIREIKVGKIPNLLSWHDQREQWRLLKRACKLDDRSRFRRDLACIGACRSEIPHDYRAYRTLQTKPLAEG
jgi:hypothetical protein